MTIDVDRARVAQLQATQSRARREQKKQGALQTLGTKARRFALPLIASVGLSFQSPSSQSVLDQDDNASEQVIQDRSGQQTVQTRLANARATIASLGVLQAGQAQARTTNARNTSVKGAVQQAIAKKQQEAEATKRNEDLRRGPIRSTQATLFSGSVLGAETVIALIMGGSTWLAWKGIEGYKTFTGADVGIFEKVVVKWNFREALTFLIGALLLGIITIIVMGILGLVGYYLMNPELLIQILPSLGDVFKIIFG
ncbi:MAG: hypothetical protein UY81_C0011G0002 [Candidatus Giovannonibacteria bacterium GW2011_GWA2_53_7]|uniref:Uncharacterized protein n=1 Tax=Candidatus Giovannonibacteria bacterium GW2011_GWA2_53_7 TaxID=1618650 RepID=A0A0G2A7F8_9BACT|nr:MAG: hypothetical protein UY81_C0011G0002 [Candidatus Giovannonibacteria bacterium GW2011_GWA2_53_7]